MLVTGIKLPEIIVSEFELHGIYDVLDSPRMRKWFIRNDDTLDSVASFLSGYFLALQIYGIDEEFALGPVGAFSDWLSWNHGTSPTAGWVSAVEELTREGETSVEAFLRLLGEFRKNSTSSPPGDQGRADD